MKKTILMLLILAISSCINRINKLEEALVLSGENRLELEKVIEHYSKNKSDSLKLKAAIFLIENMPGHYSYVSDELNQYIRQVDSLNPKLSFTAEVFVHLLPIYDNRITSNLGIEYDINTIKADFLIRNINYKFELLDGMPWSKDISFKDFCEYILPYRLDNEVLIDANKSDITEHLNKLKCIVNSLKETNIKMSSASNHIVRKIYNGNNYQITLPEGWGYLKTDCITTAFRTTEELRSIAIPTAIDFVTDWADGNSRHYWTYSFDTQLQNSVSNENNAQFAAKIYRKTFSHNKTPINNGDYIPEVFTPFIKDVTDQYIKTADIEVKYNTKNRNVYLAIFNGLKWKPIAWSYAGKNGVAKFDDLGKYIVYQPIYYDGNNAVLDNYPFILNANGEIQELIPKKQDIKLHITRKSPKQTYKLSWEDEIIGTTIIASNDNNFKSHDTIYVINSIVSNSIYNISIDSNKKYRYYRISHAKENEWLYLAELSFIKSENEKALCEFNNSTPYDNQRITDNDQLSYGTVMGHIDADLKYPTVISSIKLILRNDGNDICPNDLYELFYCDKDGWKSLGKKVAEDYFIDYENVPSGALYWLRNYSKGEEERIFTCTDRGIKFW